MIILGLTGSIGMGKSTLAAMMHNLKIPVHDSDAAVHGLLAQGGAGIAPIAAAFPDSYDKKTRSISRAALGDIIFSDDTKRQHLESILHPLVQAAQQDFLKSCAAKNYKFVCLDIPLLFETGAEKRVDYTLVVTAPPFIQRARVLSRPNMTAEKFTAILARQMPDAEKRARADYIIHTGLGLAQTLKSLKLTLKDIEAKEFPKPEAKSKHPDPRNRPRY